VPLLDTPLVEFVASLPDDARRRPGAQKALLVEALGDLLPLEILTQRKRNVYAAVGGVATRTAARADGCELRGPCTAAGGLPSPEGRSLRLDGFSCRENQLVAPLVLVRPQRVVPPTPRRINFRLRYTDKSRDEYSWDQCVPRERFGGDCLRRQADRRGRGRALQPREVRGGVSRAGDSLLA